jgi:hypothetical protein
MFAELVAQGEKYNDFINIHENGTESVTFVVEEHPNYSILYSKTSPGDIWVYQLFDKKSPKKVIPIYACNKIVRN